MFLTNNFNSIYNLSLYSRGDYNKRTVDFDIEFPAYNFSSYHNRKPYGNIGGLTRKSTFDMNQDVLYYRSND